jgi:hypothetical protein
MKTAANRAHPAQRTAVVRAAMRLSATNGVTSNTVAAWKRRSLASLCATGMRGLKRFSEAQSRFQRQ